MDEILKKLTEAHNLLIGIIIENQRKTEQIDADRQDLNERMTKLQRAEAENSIKQEKYKEFDSVDTFKAQVNEKASIVREAERTVAALKADLETKLAEVTAAKARQEELIKIYRDKIATVEKAKIGIEEQKNSVRSIIREAVMEEMKGKGRV